MFVKSVMKEKYNCIYVEKDDTVKIALDKLENEGIDALPVIDGDLYVGMVTRPSIYKAFFEKGIEKEDFLNNIKVSEIAIFKDLTVKEDEVFEQVLIKVKDSPIVAVIDENNIFKGIVTRFDTIEQFQSAFGVNRKGVRISFTSVETEGRIARLASIVQQYHEKIISLATFDDTDKLVRRIVMKIEKNDNIDKFVNKLESNGFRILDIREE